MNVHSLSSPLVYRRFLLSCLLRTQTPRPRSFQDFVSVAETTACCDMTGTGCSGATPSPNGVGVGCAMNWQIAVTTLRMQVAYTAVSILLRPFSSESTRSPYID